MTSEEWRVIVDWSLEHEAERELDTWLRGHEVARLDLIEDIRMDFTRSVDGVRRVRYSVRSDVRLPVIDETEA